MGSSELFRRYEVNPILQASDWPYTVNAVFNPGVARFGGETLLLVRVEDRTGLSHLCVARSDDGKVDWTIETDRQLLPEIESEPERFGIEDPRITLCGDEYMIVYTGYSSAGPLVCLASTRDFESFKRRGTPGRSVRPIASVLSLPPSPMRSSRSTPAPLGKLYSNVRWLKRAVEYGGSSGHQPTYGAPCPSALDAP